MREGAGALRCARNASLLHKLNPALQMSGAKSFEVRVYLRGEERGRKAGVGERWCQTLTGN